MDPVDQLISPYSYGDPINEIDLEGLVKIAVIATGRGDETTFYGRAKRADTKFDNYLRPSTGKEFLKELAKHSSSADPITDMSIFSHAYDRGIIMKNNEGFYSDKNWQGAIASFFGIWDQRDIGNLVDLVNKGEIVFGEDATVRLYGCNLATGDFAQKLADELGVTVIAAKGRVSPEIVNDKETGRVWADNGWFKFSPGNEPEKLGKRIETK